MKQVNMFNSFGYFLGTTEVQESPREANVFLYPPEAREDVMIPSGDIPEGKVWRVGQDNKVMLVDSPIGKYWIGENEYENFELTPLPPNATKTRPAITAEEQALLHLMQEQDFVHSEMTEIVSQIDYIKDGDFASRTNFWGADEEALRAYRVALKNYISADGTINGDRPVRP